MISASPDVAAGTIAPSHMHQLEPSSICGTIKVQHGIIHACAAGASPNDCPLNRDACGCTNLVLDGLLVQMPRHRSNPSTPRTRLLRRRRQVDYRRHRCHVGSFEPRKRVSQPRKQRVLEPRKRLLGNMIDANLHTHMWRNIILDDLLHTG